MGWAAIDRGTGKRLRQRRCHAAGVPRLWVGRKKDVTLGEFLQLSVLLQVKTADTSRYYWTNINRSKIFHDTNPSFCPSARQPPYYFPACLVLLCRPHAVTPTRCISVSPVL
jgi:hypothetical protein